MKTAFLSLAMGGAMLAAGCAHFGGGTGPAAVSESVTVDAPAAEVWAVVGEYNNMNRWHPAVKISRQMAEFRHLVLHNDAVIVEEETARDDAGMSYSYRIVSGPLPVSEYQSSITVTAVSDSQSTVTWSSTFNAETSEATSTIREVYKSGLNNLESMY